MAKILVVGLNPAWQSILEFANFIPGEVNRSQRVQRIASGKGINTAKVLRRFGHEVWLLQILGGQNGKRCLDACEAMGIKSLVAWVESETRQCLTLVDGSNSVTTEVIEPFEVHENGIEKILLDSLPSEGNFFDALILSGTIPTGIPDTIYANLLTKFNTSIKLVDSWQGLDMESIKKATCLKLNLQELTMLQNKLGSWPIEESDTLIAITAGAHKAYIKKAKNILAEFTPQVLAKVLNPIGAGDTVTAGFCHFMLQDMDAIESFKQALALGSASCLNPLPAEFLDADFHRLQPGVIRFDG